MVILTCQIIIGYLLLLENRARIISISSNRSFYKSLKLFGDVPNHYDVILIYLQMYTVSKRYFYRDHSPTQLRYIRAE